jgi:hypothetical protein
MTAKDRAYDIDRHSLLTRVSSLLGVCWKAVGRIIRPVVPYDAKQVRGPACSICVSLFSQGYGYGSLANAYA